jgi:hypothetical protein
MITLDGKDGESYTSPLCAVCGGLRPGQAITVSSAGAIPPCSCTTAATINTSTTSGTYVYTDPFCHRCGGVRAGRATWVGGMEIRPCLCPPKVIDLGGITLLYPPVETTTQPEDTQPLDQSPLLETLITDPTYGEDAWGRLASPEQQAAAEPHIRAFWEAAASPGEGPAIEEALWGEDFMAGFRAGVKSVDAPPAESLERIFGCTCQGGHFVRIANSPYGDETEIFLHVEDYYPTGVWQRIKGAWRVLRGYPHNPWFETILSPQQAIDLAQALCKQVNESIRRMKVRGY